MGFFSEGGKPNPFKRKPISINSVRASDEQGFLTSVKEHLNNPIELADRHRLKM